MGSAEQDEALGWDIFTMVVGISALIRFDIWEVRQTNQGKTLVIAGALVLGHYS